MKSIYIYGVLLSITIVSIVIFLADHTPQQSVQTHSKIHYSILQSKLYSDDPLAAIDTNSQFILSHVYDGLVSWDQNSGILPQIANRWETNDNATKYRFHINEGLKFQNGDPINLNDILLCFNRLVKTPGYYQDHFKNIKKINGDINNNIEFTLKKPDIHFPLLLAGSAAKIYKMQNDKFIGSGPFSIQEKLPNQITLTRSNYYTKPAKTEKLVFRVGTDKEAKQWAAEGKIDDAIIVNADSNWSEIPKGQIITQNVWATWAIGFDQRHSSVSNIKIRNWLASKLTSDSFVKNIYPDQIIATGLTASGMIGWIDQNEFKPTSIEEPKYIPEDIVIHIPNVLDKAQKISDWLYLNSQNKVKVQLSDFDWMIKNLGKGTMPAFILSFNAEYPSPYFFIEAMQIDSKSNFFGINIPLLKNLVARARNQTDRSELTSTLQELNKTIISSYSVIPLMHVRHHAWVRNCVNGVNYSPVSEGYFSLRNIENLCSH